MSNANHTSAGTESPPWLERQLQRVMAIEPDEIQGAVLSFAYFFAVLCAYYIIRPVRDEMGVTVGQAGLEKLFTIVFVVMLAAVPLFGWVVSRFEKRRIVPYVYAFFIANLLGFWALLGTGTITAWVASAFFVWASVFNLFVVSMFWILMSDLWRTDQARRLYGFIAAGGSAGATDSVRRPTTATAGNAAAVVATPNRPITRAVRNTWAIMVNTLTARSRRANNCTRLARSVMVSPTIRVCSK